MRISTLEFYQRGVDGMIEQQRSLSDLQNKITLGKRLTAPSDDPVGATRSLTINQTLKSIDNYLTNGSTALSNLEAEDAALQSVNNIYQRIHELAVQAGNTILSNTDRQAIAAEMEQRLQELQGLANSKNPDGAYMFSGTKANTQAVRINANGQYLYQGDEGQQTINLGSSTIIPMSDSAKELFFLVPSDTIQGNSSAGIASQTTANSGLVASGSLSTLDANELVLNGIIIAPSSSDGVSSSDSSGSALALALAINATKTNHGVTASALPNTLDMGMIAAGGLAAGDLTLNGINIVDAVGTEQSIIAAIQAVSDQTGVTASQPGGPGTALILSAQDGRNIQLQTDGASAANFGNFDLNSGANDQVQRSGLSLRNASGFLIGGSLPSDIGLTAGQVSVSSNTGSGKMTTPILYDTPSDINETYSIIFNAGGTSYDVVADSNPSQPLEGFNDVPYVPGQPIKFNGINVSISGTPNAGDIFNVQLNKPANQDVFTTIKTLINQLRSTGDTTQLSYEVGVALNNLSNAETKTLEVRAKVGARLNIVDSQNNVNQTTKLLNQKNLSEIEDLDYTQALSQLSAQSLTLQAAQQSYVQIQSLSLFNFLR